MRIQTEERGRNALSGAVLHSLGHSHQMSESPHPPSCPTSDGDDERSCGQVEQSEQGHPHGVVYRQQCLPSSYQPTRHRSVRNLPQQEASGIRQPMPRPTGLRDRRSEHGLEQSSPDVRISSNANSPQSASENQDFISHYHSDSASLANSILVPGYPQSIRSDPIHNSSVPGTPVPSGGSPDVVPQESRDVPLPCLDVVRNTLTDKGFSIRAAERISRPQRNSTRLVYEGKWAEFCSWCRRRQSDPLTASVPVVADFLVELFEWKPPLAVSTIKGYRSSIAATLPHGADITNSKDLCSLFKSFGVDRPVTKVFYPKWSLKVVLDYLIGRPFEPILRCSMENMENLTLKTVFLVALASGRRRSELCALSWDPQCFRFSPNLAQVQLLTEPGFLAKTQKTSRAPVKITIKSLVRFTGHDLPDYKLCPVRALKAYKDRTKDPAV